MSVESAIVTRLEGPAAWIEAATGASFHFMTASLYAVSMFLPIMSMLRFGPRPVGLLLLPCFVGFLTSQIRDVLRLARQGPVIGSSQARPSSQILPQFVAMRMMWTAITVVSLAWTGGAALFLHQAAGLALLPFVVTLFLALHFHICVPPPRRPRFLAAQAA